MCNDVMPQRGVRDGRSQVLTTGPHLELVRLANKHAKDGRPPRLHLAVRIGSSPPSKHPEEVQHSEEVQHPEEMWLL